MRKWLNTKQLCAYLHISKTTLWRYLKAGKLPQPKRLSDKILLWEKKLVDQMLA
ncbi:MAG: helix-turn-helix domain-containing protein [Campylobacter sp.]|uniref:helix-turn-helix transcriptional regulator n=1 Tax=Campylobacter sp. TaxID=205 RepID=UPI002A823B53|nr:helix-turn-helix domain-containing protein [Campylobacter sp.]MCI7586420.1 helix-turn-helix domain-containing protein [Campylobacter sp.]MDY5115965.1 helix-turn-helix domain-containing protein [Campylobacter sp.]